VTGVGNEHPLENGFTFDRSIGVPFFPGTSVKGLCRAAAEQLMDASPVEIDQLFGSQPERADVENDASAGDLVFLPAYPARDHWPRLEVDIINNHHPSYTKDLATHRPVPRAIETDSPVPVFFLVVAARTPFTFRIGSRSGAVQNVASAFRTLESGLDLLGLGAKTAAGYGTFVTPSVNPKDNSR
jgi:CRISPR-associated protein Cmr6